MPYIDATSREEMLPLLTPVLEDIQAWTDGALNYAITRIVCAWLGSNPSYHLYNQAIGVLECAKLELYRRAVATYEDDKRDSNGDVYPESYVVHKVRSHDFVAKHCCEYGAINDNPHECKK